jgi:hypothetical protein
MWVGLLYNMMCLSTQYQQAYLASSDMPPSEHSTPRSLASDSQRAVDTFRERTIQCLVLGHYTKGGPCVMETLILYFLVEVFLVEDMEIGNWILVGTIVHVAIHMGYHRDATHFPSISPFSGEMRRRVWAMLVQLDCAVSMQMGLPRNITETQVDTAEPRNIYDSDFDEHTTQLPPSRPDTEVTPMLYVLAKLRLISRGIKIADVVTAPRQYSYARILELDEQIKQARDGLPSSMRWGGLASCLTVSPSIMVKQLFLEVGLQRSRIDLHRKFLLASHRQQQYAYSRSTCVAAAMKILEFQHLIDEEIQVEGRLYQSRWRMSTAFTHDFLLATSILCFYLQLYGREQQERQQDPPGDEDPSAPVNQIRQLLTKSQAIWGKASAVSKEARRAAAALRVVLGESGLGSGSIALTPAPTPTTAFPYFPGLPDLMPSYEFPGLDVDLENEMLPWQRFASNLNGDEEQWGGLASMQQMNLTPGSGTFS